MREPISQAQCVAATSSAASSHPPSRRRDLSRSRPAGLLDPLSSFCHHEFFSSEVVRPRAPCRRYFAVISAGTAGGLVELAYLSDERAARVQHALHDRRQRRLALNELANADLERLSRHRTDLQSEPAQDSAHAKLDIDELAQQGLARRNDRPHLL